MNSAPSSRAFESIRESLQAFTNHVRRREPALFVAGLLLFMAGGANLIVTQQRATTSLDTSRNLHDERSSEVKVLGRPADESVASYLARKKSLLASRSKKDPTATSLAVVSFDSYRTSEQVESFLSANKLSSKAAILRVALEGSIPEEVRLTDPKVSASLAAEVKSRAALETTRAEELEKIIPTVSEADFRSVYQEDASRRRKAAEILTTGAVWFALVVDAPLSALSKAAAARGVRLVDIPEEPDSRLVSLDSHTFRGILPEES